MKSIVLFIVCLLNVTFSENNATVKMATTTSTENSGLLKFLLPEFLKDKNIEVQVIAVGSGKALKLAENGEVDLVFSHAPKDEEALVSNGFGIDYWKVMYNDFVIAGPASDSAHIGKEKSVTAAFQKMVSSQVVFISRGDESGTHKKEKEIWTACGIVPSGKWYMSVGQGMEACLIMANEKMGYTLTDRGTYHAIVDKIKLAIISQGDTLMKNQYGIMAVNPQKHKHVKYNEARAFIDWIVSEKGQKSIASFSVNGKQLFFSNATRYKNN